MKDILVLDTVVEKIVRAKTPGLILCGKRDYVRLGARDHDFIFHVLSGASLDAVKEDDFFYVPRIPEGNPVEEIYMMHRMNPGITTFVSVEEKPRIRELNDEKTLVHGRFLQFFDVFRKPQGLVVERRDSYFTASKMDFSESFENYRRIFDLLRQFRLSIDKKYKS